MAVTEYREVIHMTAANDAVDRELIIQAVHYSAATTGGHKAVIIETDTGDDNVVFSMSASGAGDTDFVTLECPVRINGIKLSTLGSGEVTIYKA
jgi:hypothetical protein